MERDLVHLSVEQIYGDWGIDRDAAAAIIDDAPPPRSLDMLYDTAGRLGITAAGRLLDIGCRDAQHAEQLAMRFHCDVIAADLIRFGLTVARRRLGSSLPLVQASIDVLPFADATFTFVWCRDMLNHVPDLPRAIGECGRVLQVGAPMLVYQTFATPLLAAFEADEIYARESIPAANMDPTHFERAATGAGFKIESKDELHGEWREEGELAERTAHALTRISRMRRDRKRIETALGREMYAHMLGGYQWGVFQMLGKLMPTIYVLRRN